MQPLKLGCHCEPTGRAIFRRENGLEFIDQRAYVLRRGRRELRTRRLSSAKTWMPGTSPGMTSFAVKLLFPWLHPSRRGRAAAPQDEVLVVRSAAMPRVSNHDAMAGAIMIAPSGNRDYPCVGQCRSRNQMR
jgi:hypothetical protein